MLAADMSLTFEFNPLFTEFDQDIEVVPKEITGRNSSQGLTYKYYVGHYPLPSSQP